MEVFIVKQSKETKVSNESITSIEDAIETILGKDNVTLTIRNRETGEIVYTYRGEKTMRPASNMKIISGAAALSVLGLQHRFKTELFIDGTVENGVLNGNVFIKGSGDPTLNVADFEQFGQLLKQRGIKKVNGHLIGDDTLFVGNTLPPGVDDEGETHYYGARISAITMSPNADFDASTIVVTATAESVGTKPSYTVIPHLSGLQISNEAQTVPKDDEDTLEIRRVNNTNQVIISGNLPEYSSSKVWVSLQDPTKNTLQLMKHTFEQCGIEFSKDSEVQTAPVVATAQLLYIKESLTVAEIFPVFMKLSNNSIADIFTKTMGKKVYGIGDYVSGLQVLKDYMQEKNVSIENWNFVDGSGLSHDIRVTSNGLTQLLFELQKEPYFELFFKSLPVAGHPERLIGGTLKERFSGKIFENSIIAKTGYIHEVNTLSGYMKGASGTHFIFSILLENREEGIPYLDAALLKIIQNL